MAMTRTDVFYIPILADGTTIVANHVGKSINYQKFQFGKNKFSNNSDLYYLTFKKDEFIGFVHKFNKNNKGNKDKQIVSYCKVYLLGSYRYLGMYPNVYSYACQYVDCYRTDLKKLIYNV